MEQKEYKICGLYDRLYVINQRLSILYRIKNKLKTCLDMKEYIALCDAINQLEFLLMEQRNLIYPLLTYD